MQHFYALGSAASTTGMRQRRQSALVSISTKRSSKTSTGRYLSASALPQAPTPLVDKISEEARALDLALGMSPLPLDPMTLMVTLADLKAAIKF